MGTEIIDKQLELVSRRLVRSESPVMANVVDAAITELGKLRAKLAAMESQESELWSKAADCLEGSDAPKGAKFWRDGMVNLFRNRASSSNQLPADKKPSARITEQDARGIATSVLLSSGFVNGRNYIDPWLNREGRTLLNKLNADREQVPAVAVPDDHMHVSEFIDLCKSFSSRTGSIYIGDVEGALSGYLSAAKTFAPSHSQQSAGILKVWYGSIPESNGKKNWTAILWRDTGDKFDLAEGYTVSRSEYPDRVRYDADCLRHLIGELAEKPFILNYDSDKCEPDRCPSHESEQGEQHE